MKLFTTIFVLTSLFLCQNLPALSESLSPIEMQKVLNEAECLYNEEEMDEALNSLAKDLNEQLRDKNPLILCVLKGAIVTAGKLLPKLNFPLELDYIHASRYRKDQGYDLSWYAKPQKSLEGRTVVLLDDIIDEGLTLACLTDYCKKEGAKEVLSAVLIDKNRTRAQSGLSSADFVGLKIPNKFIIGYGLDYDGYFRNMPGIFVMPENARF